MKTVLTAITAFAILGLAFTGCQTNPQSNRFDQADANHDGKLSRDEINTYLVTGVFESRDANHDKKLTREEWLVGDDAGQAKSFRDRDTNHDGVVTLGEAVAYGGKKGMASQFAREADKDKDGNVSRGEATAYYGSKEGSPR